MAMCRATEQEFYDLVRECNYVCSILSETWLGVNHTTPYSSDGLIRVEHPKTAPQPPTRAIPCPIDESIAAQLIEAVQPANYAKPGLTDAGF
jgi:hypothetical protein